MHSALPGDDGTFPSLLDDPTPLSATPPSSPTPFTDAVASAGAGAPPLPSETPFCAGRVNWETPSIWLTSRCLSNGCLTEAYLEKVAALTPGQSLRIEAEVPKAEIQKALTLLKPGTHLMLNYIFVDNDFNESKCRRIREYYADIVKYIPSDITIHICPTANTIYAQALSELFNVSLTLAFREGRGLGCVLDVFSDSCNSMTYSILPEHCVETVEKIASIAFYNEGAICFEEGVPAKIIYLSVALKERPKFSLPIPSVWSMESMIDELTVSRPFTFVPHSSTTVEEMQRLARMCHVGKCELALDARHTKAQVIAVANSLPRGARLFLSTDEQVLRLQVAKRMPPGSELHLSGIKSVKEISDILAVSQETVNVVLPVSVSEHITELQRKSRESGYQITTNSDGSFGIRKEPIDRPPQIYNETLAELLKRWRLPPDFDQRDLTREEDVLGIAKLGF